MTDNSGAGLLRWARTDRAWQSVLAAGVAVLTAAAATLALGVRDPASADTFLTSVTQAVVALPDGTEHEARIGELLPRGAQLRTGAGGGAVLSTDGRDVLVDELSTVRVQDGVRQVLERGQVMVDTRRGAGLDLETRAGTVAVAVDGLARVEQGLAGLRLGVYEGSAELAVAGRQATAKVPGLYQLITQYGALPGRRTALALARDRWDAKRAANLYRADTQLTNVAADLGGDAGAKVLSVAAVALREGSQGCGSEGERALSVAVAEAARAAGTPSTRLSTVCSARADGGSWGVVAAIVRATTDAVSAQLAKGLPTPDPGTVQAGGPPDLPGLLGGTPSPSASTGGAPSGGPSGRPTGSTATPIPTASPTTVVDDVVAVVTGLLPVPTVAPQLPLPPLPSVSPAPAKSPLIQLGPITIG